MISLICGIFKKSKQNKNRLIETKNNLKVARGVGGGEMGEKGKGKYSQ